MSMVGIRPTTLPVTHDLKRGAWSRSDFRGCIRGLSTSRSVAWGHSRSSSVVQVLMHIGKTSDLF